MGSVSELSFRRHRKYWILSTLWIVLVLGGLSYYLVQTYRSAYQLVSSSSENEAAVLALSMNSALRRAESVMTWAEHMMLDPESGMDHEAIHAYLLGQMRLFPEVHGFVVYDQGALPILSTVGSNHLCDVTLSEYIDNPAEDISFSDTVDCTMTGTRIMLVYRRMHNSEREPTGTIATVINLSHYEQLFSRIDVGDNGMVSMRRADTSRLVVRWPIKSDRMNNAAPGIPPQRMIEAGTASGVERYVGATDGIERVFAYNRVENYPFYVLVGRGYREQFFSWRMISGIAVGVVVMLVLLTLFLLRRLNRETMEVILADTTVRKTLQEKEGLIRELLHRTNNSLQVIRSLVQLELISDPSADGYGALARLDYRVGVLSLVQQELGEENDYTWISLCRYLETVWSETVRVHGIPDDWICSIDCPETRLVLDAATPLGLIVGELFSVSATAEVPHRRQSETVRIGVSVTETGPDSLTVVYTDDRELSVHGETVQLITSLATHQLAGSVSWSRVHHFACTVAFAPTVYRPRVET